MGKTIDLTERLAARMATGSSRRGFLRMAGASALGLGLAMHGVSLAEATSCSGCGGCDSDHNCHAASGNPICSVCVTGPGGGCDQSKCSISGIWTCCSSGCVVTCEECCCSGQGCHCFFRTGARCGAQNCPFVSVA